MTIAQIDVHLDAAWEAFTLGHSSYTVGGRTVNKNSLAELHRHIDWLTAKRNDLTEQAEVDAETAAAPVVRYQEPS